MINRPTRFEDEYKQYNHLLKNIHSNVRHEVIMSTIKPPTKLLDWIETVLKEQPEKLDWDFLSFNPAAIDLLKAKKIT